MQKVALVVDAQVAHLRHHQQGLAVVLARHARALVVEVAVVAVVVAPVVVHVIIPVKIIVVAAVLAVEHVLTIVIVRVLILVAIHALVLANHNARHVMDALVVVAAITPAALVAIRHAMQVHTPDFRG